MKVTLFMAMSINGYIADKNGSEDFLSDDNWKSLCRLAKRSGCFIVGRKTYDSVKKWKDYNFDDIKDVHKIVVTRNLNYKAGKNYHLASSPQESIKLINTFGHKSALLIGGGKLNASFLKKGLIDEIVLNIEPYLLGNGIKLFARSNSEAELRLIGCKIMNSGIIQLHYKVKGEKNN